MKPFRATLTGTLTLTLLCAMLLAGITTSPAYATEVGFNWAGQYWNNDSFSGNPTVSRTDNAVNFNWGGGSPDGAIPANNFSARWSLTGNFGGGLYTFRVGADNIVQLYIDNNLIIDKAFGGTFGVASQQVNLGAGQHTLRVDYRHFSGNAVVLMDWEPPATGGLQTGAVNTTGLVTATFVLTPVPSVVPTKILPPTVEVIIDFANIRPDPSTNNPPIKQARLGQRFLLTGYNADGAWWRVDLGNGQFGWLARRTIYIFPGAADRVPVVAGASPTAIPGPVEPATGVAKTDIVLRASASRRADAVGSISAGENFSIIALSRTNRAWVKVRLSNGQTGWVFVPYILVTNGNLNRLPITD